MAEAPTATSTAANPDGRLFAQVTSRICRNRTNATAPDTLTNTEAPKGTDLPVHTRKHLNAGRWSATAATVKCTVK